MRVLVAPDSFGGSLSAREAAAAIAEGWSTSRPGDDVTVVPMSDGGEGLLDVIVRDGDRWHEVEVAGPRGLPVQARWLWRGEGTAIVESAAACGLHLIPGDARDPLSTTTYGVGELLEAARSAGATRIVVGLGGSATVDGGAGALRALGYRLWREDGPGVKVGGGELSSIWHIEDAWVDPAWDAVEVICWCDVSSPLADAARVFGPQKGATPEAVSALTAGLDRWAEVCERDLGRLARVARDAPGSGAAGGLGFGLAVGLVARLLPGAAAVAEAVGLDVAISAADLVVVGEGRLDPTSGHGKVVGHVVSLTAHRVVAVVGQVAADIDVDALGLTDVEVAQPAGPSEDPARAVCAAATRLAARL